MPCFRQENLAPTGAHASFDRDFALPGDQPHYAPDRPVDVRHVALDITVDFAQKELRGTCATTCAVLFEEIHEIALRAAEMQISRVTFTSEEQPQPVELDFDNDGATLRVMLATPQQHGAVFTLQIAYSTHPRVGLNFVGPSKGDPDAAVQAHTQGQPEYAHYWFPCHDSPNDRATFALAARVPATYFALSNGKLVQIEEHAATSERTYHYREAFPFPAYIATLAVGEFSEIRAQFGDTPVLYYVRPGFEDHAKRALGDTPAMLAYYSEQFGIRYPYEQYAQIFLEDFTGAMENTSATSHSWLFLPDERDFIDWERKSTVAHELVHQWFGDLLTCRDWAQGWLNESFATYFEETWKQADPTAGEDEFRLGMRLNQKSYLGESYRRPIVYNVYDSDGQELFDRHLYEKGSCVLHMLRFIVGEQGFWRGIQHYARTNRGREVITADLERAFEEATGKSLARFFEQWVYRGGHPEFDVSYEWDGDNKLAKVTVKQTQKTDELVPLFTTPVAIAFTLDDKDQRTTKSFTVTVTRDSETFVFPLDRRPALVRFDPYGWILKTVKFDRPAAMVRWQLANDSDALGRLEAAEALAKHADPESQQALITALNGDAFWAVRAQAATSLGKIASDQALDALVSALATTEHPKARRAVATALGEFHAPERPEAAQKAATALHRLLDHGDRSYRVEAEAATSLGKTRVEGVFSTLSALMNRRTWMEIVTDGVAQGLGYSATPAAAELLAKTLIDQGNPMLVRSAAALGLRALITTHRLDPQSPTHITVREALVAALRDPWIRARLFAPLALKGLDDPAALPALEAHIDGEIEGRAKRYLRDAAHSLRKGKKGAADIHRLRRDLEEMREDNRKLRDRMTVVETKASSNGHAANGNGDAAAIQARAESGAGE